MASFSKQLDEISSSLSRELHGFLEKLVENITKKDFKISKIQNGVYYLTTKVNEL